MPVEFWQRLHWIYRCYHLIYFLFFPVYFEISVIVILNSIWFFFVFSNTLFSLCSSTVLLSLLSNLMIITLNYLLGRLLISTLFSFPVKCCFVSLFRTYFFVSLFCLIICIYLYVLGKSGKFADLGEMVLCIWCLMWPSSTLSYHQSCMLEVPPCVLCWPSCCGGVIMRMVMGRLPLAWLATSPLVGGAWIQHSWLCGQKPSSSVCGTGSLYGWQFGPGCPRTGVNLLVCEYASDTNKLEGHQDGACQH